MSVSAISSPAMPRCPLKGAPETTPRLSFHEVLSPRPSQDGMRIHGNKRFTDLAGKNKMAGDDKKEKSSSEPQAPEPDTASLGVPCPADTAEPPVPVAAKAQGQDATAKFSIKPRGTGLASAESAPISIAPQTVVSAAFREQFFSTSGKPENGTASELVFQKTERDIQEQASFGIAINDTHTPANEADDSRMQHAAVRSRKAQGGQPAPSVMGLEEPLVRVKSESPTSTGPDRVSAHRQPTLPDEDEGTTQANPRERNIDSGVSLDSIQQMSNPAASDCGVGNSTMPLQTDASVTPVSLREAQTGSEVRRTVSRPEARAKTAKYASEDQPRESRSTEGSGDKSSGLMNSPGTERAEQRVSQVQGFSGMAEHRSMGHSMTVLTGDSSASPESSAMQKLDSAFHLPHGFAAGSDDDSGAQSAGLAPMVSAARLLEHIQQSEIRLRLHTDDLGSIAIRTTIAHEHLSAQIAPEHHDLSQALTGSLQVLESKLHSEHGIQATIEVQAQTSSSSGDNGHRSHHPQPSPMRVPSISASVSESLVTTAPGSISDGRLDIRI